MWLSRAWRARWPGAAEVLWFLVLTVAYEWVRDFVAPESAADVAAAFSHARDVLAAESALGLAIEPDAQGITRALPGGEPAVTWYYTLAHTPGFVVFFWLLWRFAREQYAFIRNWFWAAHIPALVGFALYPLAPPRFQLAALEDPTADALTLGGALDWFQGFRNEYAAMPSLHIGYSLFYAVALTWLLRPAGRVRYLVWLIPAWMAWVTMATANHYWLDGVGGAVCVLLGGLLVQLLMSGEQTRPWDRRPHVVVRA